MKLTLLCENVAGHSHPKVCLAEWGFSAFVETKSAKILFDTGNTDVYKKNAEKLGINLQDTDFVVLSHNHWDHTGGLRFHSFHTKKKLITHPEVFEKLPADQAEKLKNDFEIISSREPLEFAQDVIYLGEIPRTNSFESGKYKDDEMHDDSAIVIRTPKGAVLITGCSHAGICNICEYAKKISGQNLHAVIGGFHLFEWDFEWGKEVIDKTIEYFKSEQIPLLCPMHCVDFPTQAKLYHHFWCTKYSTGDVIEIEE